MTTPTPADAPAPNVPGCTCNRNDDSWVGEDVPVSVWMCPYHLRRLEALSWATLACMVIDYEAALSPQPEVSVTPADIAEQRTGSRFVTAPMKAGLRYDSRGEPLFKENAMAVETPVAVEFGVAYPVTIHATVRRDPSAPSDISGAYEVTYSADLVMTPYGSGLTAQGFSLGWALDALEKVVREHVRSCPVDGCPCGATTKDQHDTRDAE